MNLPCSFCKKQKNGVSNQFDPMTNQNRLLCKQCATYKALQFWELNPDKIPSVARLPDSTVITRLPDSTGAFKEKGGIYCGTCGRPMWFNSRLKLWVCQPCGQMGGNCTCKPEGAPTK